MNDNKVIEALFVIHAETPWSELHRLTQVWGYRSILLLTTHAPFPHERLRLQRLADEVAIFSFADFLIDEEMARCDEQARREGVFYLEQKGLTGYFRFFMARSLRAKNLLVRDKLLACTAISRIHYSQGLGVCGEVWQESRGEVIASHTRTAAGVSLASRLRRLIGEEIALLLPEGAGSVAHHQPVLILGSAKRLSVDTGSRHIRRFWPLSWHLFPAQLNAYLLDRMVRSWLQSAGRDGNYSLCTTIHQYQVPMSAIARHLGQSLTVLVDGHHPSNYPVSYLEGYAECRFAAANHLSAEWFRRCGRHVGPRFWFQSKSLFDKCRCTKVRRVMLVLNHAGDWTALINRSDTDLLIAAFVNLARHCPDKEFVIRLHPTMAQPAHEGTGSIRRIVDFISSAGLPNLHVSRAELAEDLTRGDLYLSEYSQVLIDTWRSGKLGIAVNLTGRRSFMVDYEGLGFLSVASSEVLAELLKEIGERLQGLVDRQNQAVERFNTAQMAWDAVRPNSSAIEKPK